MSSNQLKHKLATYHATAQLTGNGKNLSSTKGSHPLPNTKQRLTSLSQKESLIQGNLYVHKKIELAGQYSPNKSITGFKSTGSSYNIIHFTC